MAPAATGARQTISAFTFKPGDSLSARLDSTLLSADATPDQVERLTREAVQYHFAAVCVNSLYVPLVASLVGDSGVGVAAVVGFPLGATPSEIKAAEAELAVRSGATEIDMVIPVGLLKAGELRAVALDVQAVREAAPRPVVLKVIVEAPLLSSDQLEAAASIVVEAGADYVKTGTGTMGPALRSQVELIRRVVSDRALIKAAGGIRDAPTALDLLEAGAHRLGTSSALAVLNDSLRLS